MNILYKDLTQEQKEYIKEFYYEHKELNFKELQKNLAINISERTLRQALKDMNINTKRKNKYTVNENFFEEINSEKKAYILGLLAADGYIGEGRANTVSISLIDKDILEQIKVIIEYSDEIKETKKGGFENSKHGYILNINSAKMRKDLNKLGLYANKSLTFSRIPNIPNDLKRHFLRGYIDGDGSISPSERKYIINNKEYIYPRLHLQIIATEELIKDFIDTFKIKNFSISQSKTLELKYLHINSKKELINMYEILYKDSTISLNRKREIWDKGIRAFNQK